MAAYSIGEVEQLTGIKSYVLRYWEDVIPCFSPQKDMYGRRVYTQRDVDIILRLKYLIYEKKFTIDGARSQIIQETALSDASAVALQALHEIREDLSSLYLMLRKSGVRNSQLKKNAPPAQTAAVKTEKASVVQNNEGAPQKPVQVSHNDSSAVQGNSPVSQQNIPSVKQSNSPVSSQNVSSVKNSTPDVEIAFEKPDLIPEPVVLEHKTEQKVEQKPVEEPEPVENKTEHKLQSKQKFMALDLNLDLFDDDLFKPIEEPDSK